jgi:hypothetical protein
VIGGVTRHGGDDPRCGTAGSSIPAAPAAPHRPLDAVILFLRLNDWGEFEQPRSRRFYPAPDHPARRSRRYLAAQPANAVISPPRIGLTGYAACSTEGKPAPTIGMFAAVAQQGRLRVPRYGGACPPPAISAAHSPEERTPDARLAVARHPGYTAISLRG